MPAAQRPRHCCRDDPIRHCHRILPILRRLLRHVL